MGYSACSTRLILIEPDLLGLQMTAGVVPHIGRLLGATAILLQHLHFRFIGMQTLTLEELLVEMFIDPLQVEIWLHR